METTPSLVVNGTSFFLGLKNIVSLVLEGLFLPSKLGL